MPFQKWIFRSCQPACDFSNASRVSIIKYQLTRQYINRRVNVFFGWSLNLLMTQKQKLTKVFNYRKQLEINNGTIDIHQFLNIFFCLCVKHQSIYCTNNEFSIPRTHIYFNLHVLFLAETLEIEHNSTTLKLLFLSKIKIKDIIWVIYNLDKIHTHKNTVYI